MAAVSPRAFVCFLVIMTHLSGCFAILTGGISPVVHPESDPEIESGLKKFFDNFNAVEGQVYKPVCGSLKASQQVVQGLLYRVAVNIVPVNAYEKTGSTSCVTEDSNSHVGTSNEKLVCFTIWWRPWLKDKEKGEELIVEEIKNVTDYKAFLSGKGQL